jgi:probable rRNA maturation factor
MSISVDNQTDFQVPLSRLEEIALSLSSKEIELLIIDTTAMRELNASTRAKDSATDVLSFPVDGDFEGLPLGSIVICEEFVYSGAKAFGHTKDEEFILLFIHGLLHLLGFDHESDSGQMRGEERLLIEEFHLPDSLIIRS